MLDHYIYGTCDRISPEAPVPVVSKEHEGWMLGGAANVANNLKDLGSEVYLFGVIGSDQYSTVIKNLLKKRDIDEFLIKSSNRITTLKSRIIAMGQQLIRIDTEDKFDISFDEETLLIERINEILEECEVIVLSDYNKGVLTKNVLKEVISVAKTHNKQIILDPKGKDFSKYYGVSYIKPNKREASLASGIEIMDDQSLKMACQVINEKTGCQAVIVTLSEEGVAFYQDGRLNKLPTMAMSVYDVTGAGDTFLAALAINLACNKSLYEACEFANCASAIAVNKSGSATVSSDEIDIFIKKGEVNNYG